jgi:hypothetical protein
MSTISIPFNYKDQFFGYHDDQVGRTIVCFNKNHLQTLAYMFLNDNDLIPRLDLSDVLKFFYNTVFKSDFENAWKFEFNLMKDEFKYEQNFNPKIRLSGKRDSGLQFWLSLINDEHPIYYASAIVAAWGFDGFHKTSNKIVNSWVLSRKTPLFKFKTLCEANLHNLDIPRFNGYAKPAYVVTGNYQDFTYLKGLPSVTPEFLEQFRTSILNPSVLCYN